MFAPYTVTEAFTPEECARIIALAQDAPMSDAGLVRNETDHKVRRSELAWLDEREGAD